MYGTHRKILFPKCFDFPMFFYTEENHYFFSFRLVFLLKAQVYKDFSGSGKWDRTTDLGLMRKKLFEASLNF